MKVAILYPTVAALIEKMASLFPGITVVGPRPDAMDSWDKRILPLAKAAGRIAEWKELGLDINFDERPYSEIDFSQYDLLIESVETFFYAEDWKNHCDRVQCPIIVKVCWTDSPHHFPQNYLDKMKHFPVLVEMPSHFDTWKNSAFSDVTCVPEPVGDWWFEKEWTGVKEEVLFVLAGKDIWRPADITVCGVDIWERLVKVFPSKTHHQDGAVDFKTARQMTELFSESRVFVNLDRQDARPLAASFTEAVAAGMPVVARDLPTLSYKNFIDINGICTDDFEAMCGFIYKCLNDIEFARACSTRSREIGRASFSAAAVRPIYEAAAERAKIVFQSGS